MRSFVLLLALFFLVAAAFAQKKTLSENKQAQKAYEDAGRVLSAGLYDQAITQLKAATGYDANFTAAYQQLGDVYRKKQDYENAKLSYRKVLAIDPEFYQGTYFGLGESELNTGEYEHALGHFKKYATYTLSEESRKRVAKYMADCEFSIAAVKKPVPFKPVNLGVAVNTKEQEYLPVVTADESTLIFTRMAGSNENFYMSTKQDKGWMPAVYLSRNINTDMYNEGAQCISPDGMYLFFTGCNRPDVLGRCDIFVSRREGKEWSKPFNIGPPVNTPNWETQPSLSADGHTLYFVSSRPGGLGGSDIWKSELKPGGGWSDPVNLGPAINTAGNELSPFIHPDDETLYFSSDGWPGLGSTDIFLSRKDAQGKWQKPLNLGYPINSFRQESSLTISSNGKTAFFSSDKESGFGGMDIYSFELPAELRPRLVTYVKGTVFDKKTGEMLNAGVKITNVANSTVVYDDASDPETGQFLATMPAGKKFALTIQKEGYLFYSGNFSLDKPASADKPFNIRVPLEKIQPGAMAILNNIFFETNKFDLLPESKVELQQLIAFMNANPGVSIEISGHTDNVGSDSANQLLSENRAKAVYNFLVDGRIPASRLTFKGYGKTKPVTDNLTEEGRQANRRTEFRITKIN